MLCQRMLDARVATLMRFIESRFMPMKMRMRGAHARAALFRCYDARRCRCYAGLLFRLMLLRCQPPLDAAIFATLLRATRFVSLRHTRR